MKRKTATIAALALFTAACGGGETTSASSAADEGIESFDDLEWESPIADFLGQDTSFDFNSDEAQAEFTAQATEAEEQIAVCMRAEGFEYIPVDQGQFAFFGGESEELPYFSTEWIAKYGFGISTQRFAQSEVGPDLVGFDDSQFEAVDQAMPEDPNQDYIESLSPTEQDAYYEALYGDQPELPEDATEAEWDAAYENFEPSGCANEAWENTDFGGGGEMDFYEEFGDDLEALYERLEADPRVAEHNDRVAACVADKGLVYAGMEDLYERWESRLSELQGGGFGPMIDEDVDFESMSDEELDAFFADQSFELSDEDKATLGEIQAEEIELATTVVECGGGPLNDEVVLGEIRVEYEREFLEANSDRLAGFEGSASGS